MSHGPSTLGSITTSSLSPTSPTISMRSSSTQGLFSALTRVHRPGRAEIVRLGERDEAAPRRDLRRRPGSRPRDCRGSTSTCGISSGDLGADLLEVRRHEMDHPLEPHRQLAPGLRRADGERLEEAAREFHGGLGVHGARSECAGASQPRPAAPGRQACMPERRPLGGLPTLQAAAQTPAKQGTASGRTGRAPPGARDVRPRRAPQPARALLRADRARLRLRQGRAAARGAGSPGCSSS